MSKEPDTAAQTRPVTLTGDEVADAPLRPRTLTEFAGQDQVCEQLRLVLGGARNRGQAPDHVLLSGPPGLGKTTLAAIIATELDVAFMPTSGPAFERPGDIASILTRVTPGSVLFIDEIHRMPRPVEEVLYTAMEDFAVDIIMDNGPTSRSLRLDLPPFTLVGATTRTGLLSNPLRDRFGLACHLDYYDPAVLATIVRRSATIEQVTIDDAAATEIARRSRGTPRIANRLLRRVRDWADVHDTSTVTRDSVCAALDVFGVDARGLDDLDQRVLHALVHRFDGGPVGLHTLATAVGEEPTTLQEAVEPFLIQQGLLNKTPRGRVATTATFDHLGVDAPPVVAPQPALDL